MASERNMLTISPEELLLILRKKYLVEIPDSIETPEQMQGKPKDEVEDALCREEIFKTYSEISENTYKTLSRMITTRQQALLELRMTDGIPAYGNSQNGQQRPPRS